MNQIYRPQQAPLTLESDIASEFPLYIYWPKDKSILIYSRSITDLLDDDLVTKPLTISPEGISFLLQSGVVPPPKSIYQDIFILGVGDKADIRTIDNQVQVKFEHSFPFLNSERRDNEQEKPDVKYFLNILADATISRLKKDTPSFLFHSAGKDSNSVALALAEAGWQDKVTLITHKSKGAADESTISAQIAQKLGFKHQVLHEVDHLKPSHEHLINNYFHHAPFPCIDNTTLAYPLYLDQIPELRGSNIIDGGGNDVYMMIPPSHKELTLLKFSKWMSIFPSLRERVSSESILNPILRTPAEWSGGVTGLSLKDSRNIFPQSLSVFPFWKDKSSNTQNLDFLEFKTDLLTTITASELHIRKARNFTNTIGSNLVLPFANEKLARFFSSMPERYLTDRTELKNKIFLRKVLKDHLDLDSDLIGKKGWTFDSKAIVHNNQHLFIDEIKRCHLWDPFALEQFIFKHLLKIDSTDRKGLWSAIYIYRLFLISAWINHNKYLR